MSPVNVLRGKCPQEKVDELGGVAGVRNMEY